MKKRTDEREDILKRMGEIRCMRRGKLTEQYNKKKAPDGSVRKWGPYFTLQAWRNGKNHSVRIPSKDASKVREELKAYDDFSELCERYVQLGELEAMNKSDESKKKPGQLRRRSGAKQTNS